MRNTTTVRNWNIVGFDPGTKNVCATTVRFQKENEEDIFVVKITQACKVLIRDLNGRVLRERNLNIHGETGYFLEDCFRFLKTVRSLFKGNSLWSFSNIKKSRFKKWTVGITLVGEERDEFMYCEFTEAQISRFAKFLETPIQELDEVYVITEKMSINKFIEKLKSEDDLNF